MPNALLVSFPGFIIPPQFSVGIPQVSMALGTIRSPVIRILSNTNLVRIDCLRLAPQLAINKTEMVMSLGIVWLDANGLC